MLEIILECNADETLMKALGYTRKMITHQLSRGEVVNYVERNPEAIGVIDDDPESAKPTYFSKFQSESPEKYGIESFCIPKKNTRIIVIKPRLEEWVLKAATLSAINPQKYSMPESGHQLHKIINTRLLKFDDMLKEMLDKENPALQHLKKLIDKSIK